MSLNKIRNKIFLLCDERHSIVKLNFEIIRIRTIPEYSISLLPFSFDANFFASEYERNLDWPNLQLVEWKIPELSDIKSGISYESISQFRGSF